MTPLSTPTVHTVAVPGARLHCEVRGAGPLLLVVGSPMTSAEFAPFADALAADHTVVTFDPRGHGRSMIDNPDDDATPEQRADDLVALLDALGADSADVFGSSGGAVTGPRAGRPSSRAGCVRSSLTSRRCWSCYPTPITSARPPTTSSARSTPTAWARPGPSSWSTPAST